MEERKLLKGRRSQDNISRILTVLDAMDVALPSAAIAQLVGLERKHVNRILNSLLAYGLVEKATETDAVYFRSNRNRQNRFSQLGDSHE